MKDLRKGEPLIGGAVRGETCLAWWKVNGNARKKKRGGATEKPEFVVGLINSPIDDQSV